MALKKRCRKCKTVKERTEFFKHKAYQDGLSSQCKVCQSVYIKEKYSNANADTLLRRKRWHLRKKYGISFEEYMEFIYISGGLCSICREGPPHNKKLVVDHDHRTGKVRGILCSTCNTGVGMFNDRPELLNHAALYIKRTT